MLAWELLAFVGTVAFAMSGSISAIEEEYDILGVYALGLVTAFGGGMIRNVMIGESPLLLWEQGDLLLTAAIASSIVFFLPDVWFRHIRLWVFFDAVGLAAFSIQGAMFASQHGLPLPAVVMAALLTGTGGGIVRDLLARRKPLIFREEVYGVWAMAVGLAVGLGFGRSGWEMYALFSAILGFRMLSVYFKWRLPKRTGRSMLKRTDATAEGA